MLPDLKDFFNKAERKGMLILVAYLSASLLIYLYASLTGWRIVNFTKSERWNDKEERLYYHK